MLKLLFFSTSLIFNLTAVASNVVDAHGTDSKTANQLVKQYGKKVDEVETKILDIYKQPDSKKKTALLEEQFEKKIQLVKDIQKKYGYPFVDFQTIIYPDKKNNYTTIEVIEKNAPERMLFVEKNRPDPEDEKNYPDDLISKMRIYERSFMELALFKKAKIEKDDCPYYHCISGIKNHGLESKLLALKKGADSQRKFVIKSLKDKDSERRGAAAYLVGLFDDPHEIIQLVLPLVTDINEGVRNNAVRVIASTVEKAKMTEIDIVPFIKLLDSPYILDRNKSLWVLVGTSKNPKQQAIIKQKARYRLIELLKLTQPNNHEPAYIILKNISGKNYSEHDYKAWKKWADLS
ncbi:MAG: hypothetical protein LCH30_10245 [Proteobacteria bacterium]|nr:hypothetical protein [Pseudomonadota bacterium]